MTQHMPISSVSLSPNKYKIPCLLLSLSKSFLLKAPFHSTLSLTFRTPRKLSPNLPTTTQMTSQRIPSLINKIKEPSTHCIWASPEEPTSIFPLSEGDWSCWGRRKWSLGTGFSVLCFFSLSIRWLVVKHLSRGSDQRGFQVNLLLFFFFNFSMDLSFSMVGFFDWIDGSFIGSFE